MARLFGAWTFERRQLALKVVTDVLDENILFRIESNIHLIHTIISFGKVSILIRDITQRMQVVGMFREK